MARHLLRAPWPSLLLLVAAVVAGADAQLQAGVGAPEALIGRQLRAEPGRVASAVSRYLTNEELETQLRDFARRCSSIARLVSIGKSVQGRDIWVLEISDKPGKAEAEPNIKYVGNVHGDEPTGRVFTLALAEWLCASYKTDASARRLVNKVHLWLVPSMNPDGFAAQTRENANGKDLNRDFPDRFSRTGMARTGREQPETKAMMDWSLANSFVASVAMHEGALVANYPWDGSPDRSSTYQINPDDATFKYLASLYATSHRKMSKPSNTEFPNGGITNGAAWYPIYGSLQDWNYIVGECMELTLELSLNKHPAQALLPGLWEDNKKALVVYALTAAYGGVWGTVRGAVGSRLRSNKALETKPLGGANITIAGVDKVVHSKAQFGDYYRPLAPGTYRVLVRKAGYLPASAEVTVPSDGSGVRRNFVLEPLASKRGASAQAVARSAAEAAAGASSGLMQPRAAALFGAAALVAAVVLVSVSRGMRLPRLHRRPSPRAGVLQV